MRVFVLDPAHSNDLEPLPQGVEVVSQPAPGVEFAVLNYEVRDRLPQMFAAMPDLRVVQSLSAGVDWLLPLAPQGLTVCRAVGVHDGPVAEWVVSAILAMEHRIPEFVRAQDHATWAKDLGDEIDGLDGKTALVVGHGSIGRRLASLLAPLGVRVIGVARHPRDDARPVSDLPELVPQADFVVDLLPLNGDTERFVDAAFLARMKPGALFVNAGRGKTVDTGALLDALTAGRIRAALDVTEPEPLPVAHPLWRAPNVLITPHVAGASFRFAARAYRFAGEQLRRYAARESLLGVEAPSPRAQPSARHAAE